MATISIDIAGLEVGFTLADADAQRILAAYAATYTEPVPPQQVVTDIAQQVVRQLADFAVAREKAAASAAAADAVQPIDATIQP